MASTAHGIVRQHRRVPLGTAIAAGAGACLALAAALVTNAGIERALLGGVTGRLGWGPSLFRIMLAVNGCALAAFGLIRKRRGQAGDGKRSSAPLAGGVWVALGGFTAAAIILRLINVNSCLWVDEILTLLDFARPPAAAIVTSFPSQNQHMLYSLLAHGLLRVFGESAWALRLPAVFFGVASIWALFLLGRRLLGTAPALTACALMTFSYHHVWFSQNARGYTGLLFSATLSTWLWLEALERRSWGWWIGYALALFTGFWIHMTIAFVAAAHAIVWAVMRALPHRGVEPGSSVNTETEAGWRPIAAWLMAGSLTLQVYALSLPEFFRSALHEVSLPSEWLNPVWLIREFVQAFSKAWFGPPAALCAIVLVAAGYVGIWRRNWRAAIVMVLPALLGGAAMLGLAHNLWPRFFFFAMGFGVLIVIEGVMSAARVVFAPERARQAGLAFGSVLVLASAATLPRCYALPKQDFTGARDFVERSRVTGEPVAAVGLAGRAYREYFAPAWAAPQSPDELQSLVRTPPRTWLVYTIPIEVKAYHPAVWSIIQSEFEVVRIFPGTLNGGEIYVCREAEGRQQARELISRAREDK